jgi:hypothetical protein
MGERMPEELVQLAMLMIDLMVALFESCMWKWIQMFQQRT